MSHGDYDLDFGTYLETCAEAVPPLHELLAERNRMRREVAAAERIAEASFSRTMMDWRMRELKGEE